MYLTQEEHDFITIYCTKCGTEHRARRSCGLRFCPWCSRARALRVRAHLSELFKIYKPYPKYGLKHLTLSCPNVGDLKSGVDNLIASFRRLRNHKFWMTRANGGVCVVEIKGRPGDWHPHLHIILYSKFLPWQQLQRAWKKCSGGQAVWINEISKDRAIYYVTKYVTKIECPEPAQVDPNMAMHGRRLFMKFGQFANYDIRPPRYLWVCEACQSSDYLTEFEMRKMYKRQA